ncbi:MAG: DUF4388 domain-containing protein [Deinococcales bacterium]
MTGTLGHLSLSDLLQLLASAQRSGTLQIHHPLAEGLIYFSEGNLIHARFREFSGEEAVMALFRDERGQFEFVAGEVDVESSIQKSLDLLLMRALLDSQRSQTSQTAIDMTALAVPSFYAEDTDSRPSATFTLSSHEVALLRFVDGQRSVQTIAIESGYSLTDTKQIIGVLVDRGLLQLRDQEVRIARLVIKLSPYRLAPYTVGIDKKILRAWEKFLKEPILKVKCRRQDKSTFVFDVYSIEKAGPYIYISQDIMLRENLRAEEALLVKPLQSSKVG